MPHRSDEALAAWFLGPRAENADLVERLVTEALRDHVFWRRNYHPEDGFGIREMDKRREGYEERSQRSLRSSWACSPSSSATCPSSAAATRAT